MQHLAGRCMPPQRPAMSAEIQPHLSMTHPHLHGWSTTARLAGRAALPVVATTVLSPASRTYPDCLTATHPSMPSGAVRMSHASMTRA